MTASAHAGLEHLLYEVKKIVVGQDHFLERVLVALLAGGHLLVEGVPGLAKTLTVATLSKTMQGSFKRIQFTPDLVPADLTNRATTDANHNARNVVDLLSGFRTARVALVRMLTNADDTIVTRRAVHPRLKRELRLIDLVEFVAEHDDHHLAVIGALTR